MKLLTTAVSCVLAIGIATTAAAQFPKASKEHSILKKEAGEWDAEVTMFMGPEGPYDPPHKSKGKESNRMIGDFWLVSEFSGSFEGMKLTGLGQFGYDAAKRSTLEVGSIPSAPTPRKWSARTTPTRRP